MGSRPRRRRPRGVIKDAQRRRNARRRATRLCEQAGLAQRHARRRGYREARLAQHAQPSVVHPVGLRHHRGRALRGPRLVVAYFGKQEMTLFYVFSIFGLKPPTACVYSLVYYKEHIWSWE